MKDDDSDLVALANMLITNLDYSEHGPMIERWLSAVSDGLSDKDLEDIKNEYAQYSPGCSLLDND